ncbi:MAG: hypothetical protein HQ500_12450 [Flavobacteriales bacterium]|nr:hypothetical protein [Flavobacteriales bacterium]
MEYPLGLSTSKTTLGGLKSTYPGAVSISSDIEQCVRATDEAAFAENFGLK